MKPLNYTKTLIALAMTVVATANFSQAQDQPMSPPGNSALPSDIAPGSPLAEVVKMVQAGVAVGTIQSYVVNSQSAFNLDADKILFLKDEGVPSELVNAMLERDKVLYAGTIAPTPAPAPVSNVTSSPDTAPPPADATADYFDNTLTPYGSWVVDENYGRCWRPTAVIYDAGWRPYCDRGHWVYTDYGWYWDSDYSWGVTFHYGRWFHHARYGWCWYPDTVWAPSWVTWRSGGEYCGWAPLPPLAVYRPGFGFYYRGASVAVDFDFGLDAGCFTFVSPQHFCDRHPRSFCAPPERVAQIFRQTRVINNYNANNRTIINHGISVQQIGEATHRPIAPVRVGSLPNAERQGWHGPVDNNPARNSSNGQLRHGPVLQENQNNNGHVTPRQSFGQPAPVSKPSGSQVEPARSPGQSHLQTGVNDHTQSQYTSPTLTQQPARQYNAPTTSGSAAEQNELRQNRNAGTSTAGAPQQHGSWQLEQRQPATPSTPSQSHNYTPPAQPAPAPAQSQPHNAGTGTGQSSGKDK